MVVDFVGVGARALAGGRDLDSDQGRCRVLGHLAALLSASQPYRHPLPLLRNHDGLCEVGTRGPEGGMEQQRSQPDPDAGFAGFGRIRVRLPHRCGPGHRSESRNESDSDVLDPGGLTRRRLLGNKPLQVLKEQQKRCR